MSAQQPVTVRQATLADRAAIFDFVKLAYPDRWQYKIPARWEWEFASNPYWEGPDPPIWIAVDPAGQVVGQSGAMVEPLAVGDEEVRVGWSVDTFLLPEYRGQGLGRDLQRANDLANPIFMSLSMSDGSSPLDPVYTYIKTVRHNPDEILDALLDRLPGGTKNLVGRPMKGLRLNRSMARAASLRVDIRDAIRSAQSHPSIEVETVPEITPEFDRLWQTVSPDYTALIKRDQNYLKRKYDAQPHTDYHRLVARKDGVICGYLILRRGRPPEPNRGILTDLFTAPEDGNSIHALLGAGIAHLRSQGVESILAATNWHQYQEALKTYHFRETGRVIPMIHCREAPKICDTLLSPGSWLLGRGDHDWDQFPLG